MHFFIFAKMRHFVSFGENFIFAKIIIFLQKLLIFFIILPGAFAAVLRILSRSFSGKNYFFLENISKRRFSISI